MEWSDDNLLKLIELYKQKPRLWDPKNSEYKIKSKKNDDWTEISNILQCDLLETKKKMDSLLASFRRERQRQEIMKSGQGRDEVYVSKWFAYSAMSFLLDKFTPRATRDTEVEYVNVHAEEGKENRNNYENQFVRPQNPNELQSKKLFKSPPKKFLKKTDKANQRADEAYQILQETVNKRNSRDDSTIFGEHVACKLRQYDRFTQNYVQHLINDILFNADMGKYTETPCLTSQPLEQIFQTSTSPSSYSSSPTPSCSSQPIYNQQMSNQYTTDFDDYGHHVLQQQQYAMPENEITPNARNVHILRTIVVKPPPTEEIEDPLENYIVIKKSP